MGRGLDSVQRSATLLIIREWPWETGFDISELSGRLTLQAGRIALATLLIPGLTVLTCDA